MKQRTMKEWFETLPELPEGFYQWCLSFLPKIPIYYRRVGKEAECQCGKCGMHFITLEKPSRYESAECPYCKNKGYYEWKKVTNGKYHERRLFLLQRTTENNLVVRYFVAEETYKQGRAADIEVIERKRIFLGLGDVFWFNNEYRWCGRDGWRTIWQQGKGMCPMDDGELYAGWLEEIKNSNFKYCDVLQIRKMVHRPIINILIAFANNQAIEMYAKSGMEKLVDFLVRKEGKTKWINRRGKNLKKQLRLKDKQKIKRFVENRGDLTLLEILQMEEKKNINYTPEQEKFLIGAFMYYNGRKQVDYLLKFMSLQQLMNRLEKYRYQNGYYGENQVLGRYVDYLQMREELGYDMTNEVFLYPKNLKEKHDEMVKEKNARKDELYITRKMQEFPAIAKRYKTLCKKYSYEKSGYIVRPAMNAKEIIMEGRILHHCVGRDNYLRKHNNGETAILFLRKVESPDEPYYTIEIKNTKILQWYGLRDGKPDKEIIEPWLDEYVEHLNSSKKSANQELLMAAG